MTNSHETAHPIKAFGWAAKDESGTLSPFDFTRRFTGNDDVQFKVMYCGICHSDIHMVKNGCGVTRYPIVPGHEIVGVVTEVGRNVHNFKAGDRVGVGCLVGSCRKCDNCSADLENYCPKKILTFSVTDTDGTITFGGYSDIMVTDEHFVVHWPEDLPMEAVPLLCAGITTYSPLKHLKLDKPGKNVGVVGLGGLGHMTVKFAKVFGAKVTVISTTIEKKQEAIEGLGADVFLFSRDPEQMKTAMGTMDGIIDTVSAPHPLGRLLLLLKTNGQLIMVGAPGKPLELPAIPLILGRREIAGSCIGGLKETQEMVNFAAKNNTRPDVEVVPVDYVNTAMECLLKANVKHRYVLDIANTLKKNCTSR